MPVEVGSIVVQSALIGALFALIALGFTMIFGVGGVLNLAHGALVMVGAVAYAAVASDNFLPGLTAWISGSLESTLPVNDWVVELLVTVLAVAVAIAIVGLVSYAMYRGLVQFIEENVVITFLVTILIAVFSQELVDLFLPETNFSIGLVDGVWQIPFTAGVRRSSVIMFAFSWIVIGALWYYVTRTDGGRAIRATAMSERGARLTGVDIGSVRARTWLIAGVLAGIGGVFLGAQRSVAPDMWLFPLTIAFIIVVIGGIGSIKGSIIAAYLIGFLETGTVSLLGPSYEGIVSLIILLGVLLARPEGLFGREFHHE